MCIFSLYGCKNSTVGDHIHVFLMFMPAEVWDLNQSNIAKIYTFVHRNLFAHTEN